MTRLVLTRHGQSQWNLENRFTGWVDVDLTTRGEAEAKRGGMLMKQAGFAPDIAFTSYLRRAIRTAHLGLDTLDRLWIPVMPDWRLNERHYGALTGLDKAETVAAHGEDQVLIWRRSFDIPPPALDRSDPRHPVHDERYAHLDPGLLPGTESLKDTLVRVEECFSALVAPRLAGGESVFISAHGNSLRALVKILFRVADADILKVEVPTGNPLLIELDGLRPVEARYLDEDRAQALPPCPKG